MLFPLSRLARAFAWLRRAPAPGRAPAAHPVPAARRSADLALLAAFAASPVLLYAEELPLRDVVVTATRHETAAESIPATVTSLGRDAMDRRQPRDEADLFRDEPDIAAPGRPLPA